MRMDLGSKQGMITSQDVQNRSNRVHVDRLTTLPDELLIRIVSLLPTKDAAVTCLLSKKMKCIFPWSTSLDFDASPISHCVKNPQMIESFPTFVTFVDNVLQNYQSDYLTKFKLRFSVDFITRYYKSCYAGTGGCLKECFPDLKSAQINAWISFPLSRSGLRELDLRMHVRKPGHYQLPPAVFMCETLEVLKLDVNLGLVQVSTMPSFCLPKLKLLHLRATLISEDRFLTRLVSSCPLLEDLTVEAWWNHVSSTSICSTSLRRLCLRMHKLDIYGNTDFVQIHTPKLESLEYYDNLALQYSISNMHSLVEAHIAIGNGLLEEVVEVSNQQMVSLVRPLYNVQHLSLLGSCTKDLNFHEIENLLPKFPNLKFLDLGYVGAGFWDKVLLAILNCSSVLETLVFSEGLVAEYEGDDDGTEDELEPLELEREFCRRLQPDIPLCCMFYLKRIEIKYYNGKEREVELIQFLLRHALVLAELVICRNQQPVAEHSVLESRLKTLLRASDSCSMTRLDGENSTRLGDLLGSPCVALLSWFM